VPELPDVAVYIDALETRIVGRVLLGVRVGSVSLVRTVDPPLADAAGHTVAQLRRVGKRIAIGLDDGTWLVVHLMIAGRLHWRKPGARLARRSDLAAFDFDDATLLLTEAGTKRRASLSFVRDEAELDALDPGGIDVFTCDIDTFRHALTLENRTLKRALTDPRIVSGIGNAYSDEILHAARLSPIALTRKLTDAQWERLLAATRETLQLWTARLRDEANGAFPEGVTAFRKDMAVHGRFKLPCPTCGSPVQRIRYADNETNFCATCQTGGTILSDRSLSRLLKADWPRTLEELEKLKRR
jgi:formamidopyrimidine-DNA glycosylase